MKKERKTALSADPARLKAHFERCLQAQYVHTAMGGDYAIEARGNTLYLLFEWSDGGEDWINNLDFPATPYRRMEQTWFCHRGFLRVWRALRDEVEPAVESMLHRRPWIREIVCIGYSHGAAMAVLACEDMTFLYGKRLEVSGYGFGTPRVLWGPIPRAVKSRLSAFYATVCVPDLVTTVPPTTRRAIWMPWTRKFGKIPPKRPKQRSECQTNPEQLPEFYTKDTDCPCKYFCLLV